MLFSVIVPVYNAKEYLADCIESILKQSFKDWELILVDDGSTDGSEKICDDFAAKDMRINVIHQRNGGVTKARQTGILQSKGKYVLYVDSDDWIDRNLLNEASIIIRDTDTDSICFAFKYIHMDGKEEIKYEPAKEGLYNRMAMREEIYPKVLLNANMRNMFYTITGKVIRRSMLLAVQTAIPDSLTIGEDTACSVGVYTAARNVYISENPGYYYRIHSTSVSHHFDIRLYHQLAATIQYFEQLKIKEIPDFSNQIDRYVMLVLFCTMLIGIENKSWSKISEVCSAMKQPTFRRHILRARFKKLTLKTKITYWFYKKNMIRTAWIFLFLCSCLKRGWHSEKVDKEFEKKNSV